MNVNAIEIKWVEDASLYILCLDFMADNERWQTADEIADQAAELGVNFVSLVLDDLESSDCVKAQVRMVSTQNLVPLGPRKEEHKTGRYSITRKGIQIVQGWNSEYRSKIGAVVGIYVSDDEGVDVSSKEDAETDAGQSNVQIPASDRIVSLDHNNPETEETVSTLRAVVEEVRKSNEFSELFADPDEKVIVLSEMEAGIELLGGDKVYVGTIKSLLVSKLEWIMAKLPDWSASALVSEGLKALIKLIGGS
jgi:hypothetical protein